MKGFVLFTMLLALAANAIACSGPTATPNSTIPTAAAPTLVAPTLPAPTPKVVSPTAVPTFNLGETKTYRDAEAGFEFDYPATWNMTPVSDEAKKNSIIYSATLYSWKPTGGGSEGIPPGGTKLDVGVYKNGAPSPEAALELRKQELANASDQTILSEQSWTLPSGLKATRLQVKSHFGESSELITAINGNLILLGGVGDYELLDAVGRTLRPTSTSLQGWPHAANAG